MEYHLWRMITYESALELWWTVGLARATRSTSWFCHSARARSGGARFLASFVQALCVKIDITTPTGKVRLGLDSETRCQHTAGSPPPLLPAMRGKGTDGAGSSEVVCGFQKLLRVEQVVCRKLHRCHLSAMLTTITIKHKGYHRTLHVSPARRDPSTRSALTALATALLTLHSGGGWLRYDEGGWLLVDGR